jgi:hypothetical protein
MCERSRGEAYDEIPERRSENIERHIERDGRMD